MPIISVITPVIAGKHQYLPDAYASLRAQELPPGWTWQWVVQEDGRTGLLAGLFPDERVSIGMGLPGRAAVARTMALSRAEGELVRTLDADDVLTAGALARDIEILTAKPEFAWVTSACLDLLPDGDLRPGPYDPPEGELTPERLWTGARRELLTVQSVTLATHTELLHLLGGWPALTGAETVALLLSLDAVSDGWFISEPSMRYRKHDDQTTQSDQYWTVDEVGTRSAAFFARSQALRRADWRWRSPWRARRMSDRLD